MSEDSKNRRPEKQLPSGDEQTLDFIYEHTKEAPNIQVKDSEQLDTKIAAVFAAATVAVGLAARLPAAEGPNLSVVVASWTGQVNLVDVCICLSAIAWGLVAITTLRHLRTKKHRRSLRADVLWLKRNETVDQLKTRLVKDWV